MRIQSEYVSFNNCWTITSRYDFQAYLPDSRPTCSIPGVPAAFQAHLNHSRRTWSIPGAPAAFPKKMFFPHCSSVIRGASSLVTGALRLVTSAPRLVASTPGCTHSSLRRTKVFPNLSQSLPWYCCTSHWRSQLLRRPAGMPSYSLILFWNWRI